MENTGMDTNQYLTFNLGKENFALGIEQVNEIIDYKAITVLPRMSDFLRGVIDLRGMILPIIDLRVLLNLGKTEQTQDTCIIVSELKLEEKSLTMGVMVDAVQAVIELEQENISPPTKIGSRLNSEYVKGIADYTDGFLMILDINRVLSRDEVSLVEEAAKNTTVS